MKLLNFDRIVELDIIDGERGFRKETLIVERSDRFEGGVAGYTVDGEYKSFKYTDSDLCDDTINGMIIITDDDQIQEIQTEYLYNYKQTLMHELADEVTNKFTHLIGLVPETYDTLKEQLNEIINNRFDDIEREIKANKYHWE